MNNNDRNSSNREYISSHLDEDESTTLESLEFSHSNEDLSLNDDDSSESSLDNEDNYSGNLSLDYDDDDESMTSNSLYSASYHGSMDCSSNDVRKQF